jgi:hypothetical protein
VVADCVFGEQNSLGDSTKGVNPERYEFKVLLLNLTTVVPFMVPVPGEKYVLISLTDNTKDIVVPTGNGGVILTLQLAN